MKRWASALLVATTAFTAVLLHQAVAQVTQDNECNPDFELEGQVRCRL